MAFNDVFASDGEGPVDWPASFTLGAIINAVTAIARARTRPASQEDVTELMLAVERHPAEMGAFVRVETLDGRRDDRVQPCPARTREAPGRTDTERLTQARRRRSVGMSDRPAILAP